MDGTITVDGFASPPAGGNMMGYALAHTRARSDDACAKTDGLAFLCLAVAPAAFPIDCQYVDRTARFHPRLA